MYTFLVMKKLVSNFNRLLREALDSIRAVQEPNAGANGTENTKRQRSKRT